MNESRRDFLRKVTAGGVLLGLGFLESGFGRKKDQVVKIVVLHTNDVHSRIEPFPDNDPKFPGLGGCERRAALIKKIRAEEDNVLLLDAGDIFQGTPYFNEFNGELEFKLMSAMGYDATTIGNHDFDHGLDGLEKQLVHANFPFVISNYDFTGTPMEGKTITHKIFEKGGVRIGVFGLGIELDGLVDSRLYGKTVYHDPIVKAAEMVHLLRDEKKCDIVISLSHLGYRYDNEKVSDMVLGKKSRGIDLIIGAHTHTLLEKPVIVSNREGKEVYITQVGWAGIRLGKVTFYVNKKTRKKRVEGMAVKISKLSSVS